MAKGEEDSIVTLSVLDRLIDREPDQRSEPMATRAQSVRALKASLRRDIEWLLNTRRNPEAAGDEYPELSRSLFNYGLPDFSSYSFSSPRDRARLLRILEATVRTFEPRIMSVKVTALDAGPVDPYNRVLRFQITGLLKMDPAPEHIAFDTVLQLTTGEYQVKGERGA